MITGIVLARSGWLWLCQRFWKLLEFVLTSFHVHIARVTHCLRRSSDLLMLRSRLDVPAMSP